MLRRTPIFSAVDPQIVGSGIFEDIQDILVPLWKTAEGVEFTGGSVRHRREATKLLHPVTGLCRGIGQQVLSNNERALWFNIQSQIFRWDQFSLREIGQISPANVRSPYLDYLPYGDWMFINRGLGQPQLWTGLAFETPPELPLDVAKLLKFLSFVLAIGTESKGTGVAWCDNRDVTKWVEAANNTAGVLFFDEMDSPLIGGAPLGGQVAVYSESAMGLMRFIGSPYYFAKQDGLRDIGLVGPEAVTSTGSLNYGMGRQGPWRTDGIEVQYIDTGRMHNYFQDNINWQVSSKIIVARNDIRRTIEFYLPVGDSTELNEAWAFDPLTGGWSQITPLAFFHEGLAFSLPVGADLTGELQLISSTPTTTNNLLLQTKPLVMNIQTTAGFTDVHFETKVDEIELFLKDVENVQMEIGSSSRFNSAITWCDPIPLMPGQSTYLVPANIPSAPYWHLRFTETGQADAVTSGEENVLEDGLQVTSYPSTAAWKLDFQGFLCFGNVEGAARVR